ncbi:MAG: DUF1501 domain-containing protein, partial [Pirellulales bacterium]|nr:DUF1501 domain-containing protein [Pirellulales bacterium]
MFLNHGDKENLAAQCNRRTFLSKSGVGLGSLALSTLFHRDALAMRGPLQGLPGLPHHTPKVKRVIFLCMSGGPSHLETFDPKPKLTELDGQPMPESFTKGQPIAQLRGAPLTCLGPLTHFKKYGAGGQEISDYLPWQSLLADDICIVRSMVTEQINHDPAHTFMNTGSAINGRPSMGSWINYGLGSERDDLPGFVVLTSVGGRNPQPIASRQWSAGFLPSRYQGVEFNATGDPVHYVRSPAGVSEAMQGRLVESIQGLNRHRNEHVQNS